MKRIFIQIMDCNDELRLINVDSISDIFYNIIYLNSTSGEAPISINTRHTYDELIHKLSDAGVDVLI